ncbi:hypothetical protein [Spiroplasma endosymbiont of Glossina fuscipes fuscipes]|uniref:hypothetical protein n=1 Tax=Spiroplasma endosymbiont of Glossina fuscipes fuscipes TaxID=2004463 RepID=UPI003C780AEF
MGIKSGPVRGIKPCVKNEQIWKIHKLLSDYFKEYEELITVTSKTDTQFNKTLDKFYISKNRGEQRELRIILIKNNLFENCVMCAEKINKKFLIAAHI